MNKYIISTYLYWVMDGSKVPPMLIHFVLKAVTGKLWNRLATAKDRE